jgi:hypothetical protein
MIKQRILKTLTVMAVLLCVATVPALALTSKVLVTDVSPDGNSANVGVDSNITATFNIRMAKNTINKKTFYLKQEGSTAVVPAQVVYTGTTKTATLNPNNDLAAGATYTAYVKGGRTGVRGAGGQKLSDTTDITAIFKDAKVSWSFTVAMDTVAPDAPSAHLDANSNSGSKNDNLTNDNTPTMSGTAEAGSTVKIYDAQNDVLASVTVDNAGAWSDTFSTLQDGTYSYTVTTTDAAGNESQGSPISLTIDTAAPETTVENKPASLVNSASATFTFSSSESGSTFECSLDGVPFASCTSPKTVPDQGSLAEGPHTFRVRATDAAGNTEATPAIHPWTVDTFAPTVVSVSPQDGATGVSLAANAEVTFSEAMDKASVEEPGAFTLKLGSSTIAATASYAPATKKATLDPSTNLAPNTTYTATLTTGVKDLAGNALAQERSWTFTTGGDRTGVTVTPTTLILSPTDVLGCARSELLTVTNNGPDPVTFADVSITGQDAKYFSDGAKSYILKNGPFTVLAGNYFQDQVMFTAGPTPTERNSEKVYTATLTYKDGTGVTIGNSVTLSAKAQCLNFG